MRDKGLNGGNADYDVAVVAIMLVKLGGIDDTDACGVSDAFKLIARMDLN
jgi:hypothetical protein